MPETVVVKSVSEPNDKGWYEVTLQDGRTATTKNMQIAEAARRKVGESVEVEINQTQRGQFTNTYLNAFDSITDEKPSRTNGRRTPRATQTTPAPVKHSDDARQQTISKQWAYGRAVELLMASGEEFALPLDAATLSKLDAAAEALLERVRA